MAGGLGEARLVGVAAALAAPEFLFTLRGDGVFAEPSGVFSILSLSRLFRDDAAVLGLSLRSPRAVDFLEEALLLGFDPKSQF